MLFMFDKLAPLPIHNKTYRRLMVIGMIWFLGGAWLDASGHMYLDESLESFFTPWHAMLYSGYLFVLVFYLYVKNQMQDYRFDIGLLGGTIFAIGGASDLVWHTLIGIEVGIEPLLSASHILLFLGSFLMLDHAFASRPEKKSLDNTAIFAIASSYALVLFITQFLNPYLRVDLFFIYGDPYQVIGAASVFIQAFVATYVFVYTIRFNPSNNQFFMLFLSSFAYMSIFHILGNEPWDLLNILIFGFIYSYFVRLVINWYYKTNNARKMQISAALVAGLYGLVAVLFIFFHQWANAYVGIYESITWRFYGLSGLIVTPMLFGYMIGNLGVSPSTGEIVSSS